jgi:RNA polymerase sigma-70 factor (ECF subfamily)
MDERFLAEQFEQHRDRLRAVAYRMLGSLAEADDAVQEAWLRLQRSAADEIDNLAAWLTTVVTRICLNVLRSRRTHPEQPLEVHMADPIIDRPDAVQPEHEALLADAVGMALMTVLQTLPPPERVALVLHDSFAVPFEEIATILDRTPAATRQLASRARRKVQEAPTTPEPDLARQRAVVDAFFGAARAGDLDGLVAVLDPDVVLHGDTGRADTSRIVRGAAAVASNAIMFSRPLATLRPALINGAAGVVIEEAGQVIGLLAFVVAGGRIVAIDALNDLDRLAALDLSVLG